MKIAIIGGGAAGMIAAATIAEKNPSTNITIIEKNKKLGQKVVLSGGGRCNITTTTTNVKELLENYPRGKKWLRFAMHEFGPSETYKWFEDHGVPLKEEGKRVFPKSDKGTDIIEMFSKLFASKGVEVIFNSNVKKVEKDQEQYIITLSDDQTIQADKVIITTGGGTSKLLENLSHTSTPLAPTLTSFITNEKWVATLAGVSIQKAKLKIKGDKKHEFTGPILFTHKGITGPAIFAISAMSAYEKCPIQLSIDLTPDTTYENLLAQAPNLSKFIPKSVAKKVLDNLDITPPSEGQELSKKDQNRITETVKNLSLTLTSRTPGTEIVTAGGIPLKEVDQKTMESKIHPGLYFAGEILDVDGFTGGYNLQNAWSTGRLAGSTI